MKIFTLGYCSETFGGLIVIIRFRAFHFTLKTILEIDYDFIVMVFIREVSTTRPYVKLIVFYLMYRHGLDLNRYVVMAGITNAVCTNHGSDPVLQYIHITRMH